MASNKDDARAEAEAELKKICPPQTVFFNSVIAYHGSGVGKEIKELRCAPHDTMELAIECHEYLRASKVKWIASQVAGAKALAKELNQLKEQTGSKFDVGYYRMVIVKETHEIVEESH